MDHIETESHPGTEATVSVWQRRAFEKQLLNVLPDLRAVARFLTRNPTEADDLVQDTIVRALRAHTQFDLNTSMKAWTLTILRNLRLNGLRKRQFEVLDEGVLMSLQTRANQEDCIQLKEVLRAMDGLSPSHREVIALIRGAGCSYEEAAQIMKCNVGTIKSRLNRADFALREILGPDFRAERGTGKAAGAERDSSNSIDA